MKDLWRLMIAPTLAAALLLEQIPVDFTRNLRA